MGETNILHKGGQKYLHRGEQTLFTMHILCGDNDINGEVGDSVNKINTLAIQASKLSARGRMRPVVFNMTKVLSFQRGKTLPFVKFVGEWGGWRGEEGGMRGVKL